MQKFNMAKKDKVYALLFWAGWCNGCTNMKPLFYDEAKKYGVKYELIDVDDPNGTNLSIKYGVRNVPTILFFKGKKMIGREGGNNSYLNIKKYVENKGKSTI